MKVNTISKDRSLKWLQAVVLLGGVVYTLVALALLFAPEWFFEYLGNFPPYNRHYMGDLGSFLLPLAVGLLIASRDPLRYRLLVIVVLAGNFLHGFNHLFDSVMENEPLSHWLTDTLPVVFFAVLYFLAYWRAGRNNKIDLVAQVKIDKTDYPAKS